jgi:NACalpha-BTF3-like transcription factor
MSVYSRIFAATSKKWVSSGASGRSIPPQAFWAFPGLLGASWFIWDALNEDIKRSVGLYWDPDVILNTVEAEREQRMAAKEAVKAAGKPAAASEAEEEDEEEEEEEEAVTVKDIEEAVSAAIEESGGVEEAVGAAMEESGGDDDDDDDDDAGEVSKPKEKKVKYDDLSQVEKWDRFMSSAMEPGEVSLAYC